MVREMNGKVSRCRGLWLGGMVVFILMGFGLLPGSSSMAATAYQHQGAFNGVGEFNNPQRIAVHQATGNVFVVDRGGNRVRVFAPDYDAEPGTDPLITPLTDIDAADLSDGGNLNAPSAIAIDQVSGDVYVAKTGIPAGIVKFNQAAGPSPGDPPVFTQDAAFVSPSGVGSFGSQLGSASPLAGGIAIGKHPVSGDPILLLADPAPQNLLRAFTTDGAAVSVFAGIFPGMITPTFNGFSSPGGIFTGLRDVAVDSEGRILVADTNGNAARIEKFAADGAYIASLQGAQNPLASTTGIVLAADSNTDEVFVTGKDGLASAGRVHQFDIESLRLSFTVPGTNGYMTAVAVDAGEPGRLYVGGNMNIIGASPAIQVYRAAGELPNVPVLSVPVISAVGTESATFEGTVDPDEAATMWRFEYRVCPAGVCGSGTWVEMPLEGPISGVGPQPVSKTVEGLEPNTTYEVRLFAENLGGSDRSAEPNPTLTTQLAAPVAVTGDAASISAGRATLSGTVNPRNAESTRYFFEFGQDTAYGHVLPAPPGELGQGGVPVQVTVEALNLEPATTYHFRLVATNSDDAELRDEGDDQTFTTRAAEESALPERGYELVSAANTNGLAARPLSASADGNHLVYYTYIPAPGAENGFKDFRRSNRLADGSWELSPFPLNTPVAPENNALGQSDGPLFSEDHSQVAFLTEGRFDPDDTDSSSDAYIRDAESGEMTWISPGVGAQTIEYISDDGSVAIFSGGSQLWRWQDGEVTLISRLPDGQPASGGARLGQAEQALHNAVSRDRQKVVFASPPSTSALTRLYVRHGDASTEEIGDGTGTLFWGADRDVSTVIYGQGGNLVAYDVADRSRQAVTPAVSGGAGLERVFHVSDDANRIYFASTKLLPGGESTGGARSLYLAEREEPGAGYELEFIATVIPDPSWDRRTIFREAVGSPDGALFAFRSTTNLVPGRKTGGSSPQVYLYELATGSVSCLSCPADGSPASGPANLRSARAWGSDGGGIHDDVASPYAPHIRNIASDGTVFFQSYSPLVAEDANAAADVYEWKGGELQLISPGEGVNDSVIGDASEDGGTVFFRSTGDIVPGDHVSGVPRTYAARVGGGYRPQPTPPDCVGEECRGPAYAPSSDGPASAALRRSARSPSNGQARPCTKQTRRWRSARKRVRTERRKVRAVKRRAGSDRQAGRRASKRLRRAVAREKRTRRHLRVCRRAAS